jgi:hypothetical protein
MNQTAGGTQNLLLDVKPEREKAADVFEMVRRRDELLFQCAEALDELFAMGILTPQEHTALRALKRVCEGRRRPGVAV